MFQVGNDEVYRRFYIMLEAFRELTGIKSIAISDLAKNPFFTFHAGDGYDYSFRYDRNRTMSATVSWGGWKVNMALQCDTAMEETIRPELQSMLNILLDGVEVTDGGKKKIIHVPANRAKFGREREAIAVESGW